MTSDKLPIHSMTGQMADRSLSGYLKAIKRFPMLSREEEYMLAKRFIEHGDVEAAHKLVTSHLRLAAKIALGYRSQKVPALDLISEGNIGLMRAVKKFDPDRGFRLATYAIWWIKAAINEHLVNSWSLVKLGTVAAQRKLFFNLRRIKASMGLYEAGDLRPEDADKIARSLHVPVGEVIEMNRRLEGNDSSLNRPFSEGDAGERIDVLPDDRPNQEDELGEREEQFLNTELLAQALALLSPRERKIIQGRYLTEVPRTLDEIGSEYGISRERVRQIETAAFKKLRQSMLSVPSAGTPHAGHLAQPAAAGM